MEFLTDINNAFLPEIIIAAFVFINIFLSLFFNKKFYKTSQWIAILGILMSFASIGFVQAVPTYHAFANAFISNVYTVFFKSVILVASFFAVLVSHKIVRRKRARAFEYFAILFCAILAAMLLVSANDFLSSFVSFEFLALSCCLMSGLIKNYKAKEGALKYLVCAVVASALFLFGTSYIYGITGSINFDAIEVSLQGYQGSMLFALSSLLVIIAMMFKVSAVPFVNWVPDVYKGASYPVGMFLSIVPIAAGFALLSRILVIISNFVPVLGVVIIILALATIAFGAYGALRQKDMKRFAGYSTIVQSGFMLLAMGVLSPYSLAGMLYYLICFLFTNVALWAGMIMFFNSNGRDDMESYKGLAYNNPFYTTAMIFVLMSLAGLPPTSGFLAKFFVLSAIARLGFMYIIFLLVALLLGAIAVCLYFRPIKIMFEKTTETLHLTNKLVFSKFVFYFCTALTILLCMYSSKIVEFCELIAYSL